MRQENNVDSQSKIIKNIEKFTSNRNQITMVNVVVSGEKMVL